MQPGRVRASDAERESYAERIRKAVGEGRLTINEGDERMRDVYGAKFLDELGPQVADLPADPPAAPAAQQRARAVHRRGPGWYPWFPAGPLLIFAVLVGIWSLGGAHVFWPAIPLAFLTLFLIRRLFWWGYWRRH